MERLRPLKFGCIPYIYAAQRIGWELTAGHLLPVVAAEGGRGRLSLFAARMAANLQGYLRAADLPSQLKFSPLNSFRVGSCLGKSPGRDGRGRDHEHLWLEDSQLRSTTSGLPL